MSETHDHAVFLSSQISGTDHEATDGNDHDDQKRRYSDVYEDSNGASGSSSGKIKKSRQSQSCDACRARKVKCDRPPPGSSSPSTSKTVCSHCDHLGLPCTFDYIPRKRGPPNLYLRKIQQKDASGSIDPALSPDYSSRRPTIASPTFAFSPPEIGSYETNEYLVDGLNDRRIDGTLGARGFGSKDETISPSWNPTISMAIGSVSSSGLSPGQSPQAFTKATPIPTYKSPSNPPLPSPYSSLSVNSTNPFDKVLPRKLLYQIIDLYFDYVYCLVPCLHRPSFSRDLNSHREERPGEDEWKALVFAVVGFTLVQMPKAFVSMPRSDVKSLSHKCHGLAKAFLNEEIKTISVTRLLMTYLVAATYNAYGNRLATEDCMGSLHTLSLKLRLWDPESYLEVNPVERELRKRIFWLQYGGDKTWAAIEGNPVLWHEDDCPDVTLPANLDNEFITEEAYLEQPPGRTPIISGFRYISQLFRLTGQILDRRRRDRRTPPTGLMLQMRINEIEELFEQVMSLMDDCPAPLRLADDDEPKEKLSDDWDTHASADIRQLFMDPTASRATVKDGFLVQQANIYVTQQLVRYTALQYRDELLAWQQAEIISASRVDTDRSSWKDRPHPRRLSTNRRLIGDKAMFSEEERDQVASDLLRILQKIPIQVIAVNGISLVLKVRFVASTLLDALSTPPVVSGGSVTSESTRLSQRVIRAQNYLWDFLRVLSEIERLYALDDDEDLAEAAK